MDLLRISELNPELPALESRQFKAAVTLIWPYSSSARQFALLLAEPDFRLRRKKGQVRARFSGSSAKAIATTGVGIGDEVILSLRGAQFVQEGAVNTPGKSIDWELSYTQTVVVQIFHSGSEIANLELVNVAPTPASRSPVRREPVAAISPTQQWSSPAFLKRARLSDGPFVEALYDPLAEDNEKGHDRKRRRKSYRDWTAWTYSAKTPSPEKENANVEEDYDFLEFSPSRPTQLPHTPVSPSKHESLSAVAGPSDQIGIHKKGDQTQREDPSAPANIQPGKDPATRDDQILRPEQGKLEQNIEYHELYAGPDELPSDAQYAFGGDTEVDTEVNTEEDAVQDDSDVVSVSTTEPNTEEQEDDKLHPIEHAVFEVESVDSTWDDATAGGERDIETDSLVEPSEVQQTMDNTTVAVNDDLRSSTPVLPGFSAGINRVPTIVMSPPTLPTIQTDFSAIVTPGMLTPIGREPASPTLRPLDSATLPLPSPFPGERDINITSYLDHVATEQDAVVSEPQADEELEPPSDASYIFETSFFSSINSSKASALHPNHESAFTPVRFTFGMDGVGFSRPLELSSPEVEEAASKNTENDASDARASTDLQKDMTGAVDAQVSDNLPVGPKTDEMDTHVSESAEMYLNNTVEETKQPGVIDISSGSESEEVEENRNILGNIDEVIDVDGLAQWNDNVEAEPGTGKGNGFANHEEPLVYPELLEPEAGFPNSNYQTAAPSEHVHPELSSEDNVVPEDIGLGTEVQNLDGRRSQDRDEQLSSGISKPIVQEQGHESALDGPSFLSQDVEMHTDIETVQFAPEASGTATTAEQALSAYLPPVQVTEIRVDQDEQLVTVADNEAQQALNDMDAEMHDRPLTDERTHLLEWQSLDTDDHHPDVKLESIEDASPFFTRQADIQATQVSASELSHSIPGEDETPVELHTAPVPATAPARNTRSKTKTSVSPTREEAPVPKRKTRSTRSKASVASITHTTLSPQRIRTRSTISPSQDAVQTSPYSLRSQSKLLSPTKSTASTTLLTQRKHASQRSVDSISDISVSQLEERGPFRMSSEASQELPTSQDRHSEVLFEKAAEEKSILSAESKTTLKTSASQMTVEAKDSTASPDHSLTAKLSEISPSRRLRSSGPSAETASPNPRIVRRTRKNVYNISQDPNEPDKVLSDAAMPEALQETEIAAEASVLSESEPSQIRSSPPSATFSALSHNQQPAMDSNTLLTPEATQQTTMESPSAITVAQPRQSLPLTPQLTQTASAGLRSFQTDIDVDETAVKTTVNSTPIAKSTPRRNMTSTDVASAPTSPSLKNSSSDVESDSKLEQPSVGLSTPLAYYTPIKDLVYFLNRSSQFHSSQNPDVLALVTSSTTSSQRATKGPRHWNTTLHITDLSTWPVTTTVNIFRAYQTALPHADAGDIILLRSFAVKSLNRHPTLISADESSWCVWRYGKPVWGVPRGPFGEVKARGETTGPEVESGEGEWKEVERLRNWYVSKIKSELAIKEKSQVKTRSKDKVVEEVEKHGDVEGAEEKKDSGVKTRSQSKRKVVG